MKIKVNKTGSFPREKKFDNEKTTSIRSAAASVSCVQLYLEEELKAGCHSLKKELFNTAIYDGKVEVIKWGEDSGYQLITVLNWNIMSSAALNGHLNAVKYLRTLGFMWDDDFPLGMVTLNY